MKQTLKTQATRSGIALAAVAAFAAFGTVLAAPPAATPTFTSATITLENAGEAAGSLNCSFRETGLTPGGFVRYDCASQYVGVVEQCMYKNKAVGNSRLYIYNDIHPEEVENFDVKSNGSIRASIITQIPQPGEANAIICTAPAEVAATSVRWCNNTLVDLTNSIPGTTAPELFAQLVNNGTGSVPGCATLANGPFTPPGE
jgi:hypothetical protein